MSYTVVARYTAREDTADEVARLLPELAAASRTEPASLDYVITRDLEDPRKFIIVETYTDEDGLAAHRATDHFQDIGVGRIIPLLADRTVAGFPG